MIAGTLTRPPATTGELLPPELAAQLESLDVSSRKMLRGKMQGERRSKRRGRSVEFDDYREYSPGDDLRHLDWNVLARLDRFFIKLFQEEEDLALHVVLDVSASMNAGEPEACNKLLFGARLAAALCAIGLTNNNRVRLSLIGAGGPGGGVRALEPLRGRRNIERVTRFLLESAFTSSGVALANTGAAEDAFTGAMRAIASDTNSRGVMVLLSDVLVPPPEGYQPGLKMLAAGASGGRGGRTALGGMDVTILQLLAPTELDPQRSSSAASPSGLAGDLRLTDVETGRAAEVTVTPELSAGYTRAVRRYIDDLHDFCNKHGLGHELVTTDTPVQSVLIDTLRRRTLLK
ncbi:MAG: DUF58 domain-containing protein [Phycisphaerales bacterium]|nr:DUF58 domain-containing protein [Phycisphaerales bacterium]